MIFIPEIEGSVAIRSGAEKFLNAFRQRVRGGFLLGRPHSRSNYVVSETSPDRLQVRAADWQTAINVGLNRIELRQLEPGSIHYQVRYWQWARFVLGLSGTVGLVGFVLLLGFDVRAYLVQHQSSMIPGFSIEQNLMIGWLMVLFWGFIWPWILISLHKRPLHRLIACLVAEVDAKAASTSPS